MLCVWFTAGLLLAAPSARADDQAEVKALLDKAIKAAGGEEKLTKFKAGTSKLKGKLHAMGQAIEIAGEYALQLPDRLRVEIDFEIMGMKFKSVQIFNGDKGWISVNGMTMEIDKDMVAEGQEGLHALAVTQLVPLKDKAYKLTLLGESKLGDRTVVGVQVARKGQRDVNLFFDKEKYLLLKSEHRTKDMNGAEVNQETVYGDYKVADGMAYPTKLTIKQDGKDFLEAEITEYKPAEKLDDSLFAKP
jgi:hypothetical protein